MQEERTKQKVVGAESQAMNRRAKKGQRLGSRQRRNAYILAEENEEA